LHSSAVLPGMCRRFTYKLTWEEIVRLYRLTLDQAPWVNSLLDGLSVKDIETARRVVTAMRKKFET
jgi:hypothetical protein